jgi:hypothetical protein
VVAIYKAESDDVEATNAALARAQSTQKPAADHGRAPGFQGWVFEPLGGAGAVSQRFRSTSAG